MNQSSKNKIYRYLVKILLILILFINISCNQSEEVTSGVTGSCKFNEIITFIRPETLNIYPGQSDLVEVEASNNNRTGV